MDSNSPVQLTGTGQSGGQVYSIIYGYDLAGQRRVADENIAGGQSRFLTWTYDGLYRLIGESWTGTSPQVDSYSYDPAGNRLTVQINTNPDQMGPIGVDGSYTYNDQNELVTYIDATGTTYYEYDADGNRSDSILGPNQTLYSYDTSDRLIEVRGIEGASVFAAAYDAAGNRVAKREGDAAVGQPNAAVTTYYLYDNGTNFQEYDKNDAVTEELVRAGGQGGGIGSILYTDQTMAPTAGPVEYFVYNAIGDTVATTDASGQTTQTTLYDAFGKVVSQTGTSDNNRLRNTKERDASTGLDDDGRRYYDSTNGVYINRDPSGYGDGLNVYESVHDDPINGVDPLGLRQFSFWGNNYVLPWDKGADLNPLHSVFAQAPKQAAGEGLSVITTAHSVPIAAAGQVVDSAATGAKGGLSITSNTLSFGATDGLSVTDSSQYQGGAYTASRYSAVAGRELLLTAATLGTAQLARAGSQASLYAYQGLQAFNAGRSGYSIEDGIENDRPLEAAAGVLGFAGGISQSLSNPGLNSLAGVGPESATPVVQRISSWWNLGSENDQSFQSLSLSNKFKSEVGMRSMSDDSFNALSGSSPVENGASMLKTNPFSALTPSPLDIARNLGTGPSPGARLGLRALSFLASDAGKVADQHNNPDN